MTDEELYEKLIIKFLDDADAAVEGYSSTAGVPKDSLSLRAHRLTTLWNLISGAEEAFEIANIRPGTIGLLVLYGVKIRKDMTSLHKEAQQVVQTMC